MKYTIEGAHGLHYYNLGCRCDVCARCKREYDLKSHAKLRKVKLHKGDPRHGTNGYNNYGCRCDVCRAARAVMDAGRAQ